MRQHSLLVYPLLLSVAIGGCTKKRFEVVMELAPDGTVRRSVTLETQTDDTPTDHQSSGASGTEATETVGTASEKAAPPNASASGDTDVLRAVYGEPTRLANGKYRFSGVFTGELPADLEIEGLKNHARLDVSSSALGRSMTYIERMPGQVQMVDIARKACEVADLITQALFGYAVQHPDLRDQPERLKGLKSFLEGELRDDMLNLGLLFWIECASIDNPETDKGGCYCRIASYLVERGYADKFMLDVDEGESRSITEATLRKAAVAMGYGRDEDLPAVLAELRDADRREAALETGLAAMGMTMDDLSEKAGPLIGDLFGPDMEGVVIWKGISAPPATNGTWDAESHEIRWRARSSSGFYLPQILYAHWGEPDAAFQNEHFGKTVLTDGLPDYIAWHDSLTPQQQTEWDAFVDTLTPEPILATKLRGFKFTGSDRSTSPEEAASAPVKGARLILGALTTEAK